jgi:hypothetical protein
MSDSTLINGVPVPVTPEQRTEIVAELMQQAALMPPAPLEGMKVKYWMIYVPATKWGLLVKEIRERIDATFPETADQVLLPGSLTFGELAPARARAVNARTDDMEVVNALNRIEAGRMDFQARRQRAITGTHA